MMSEFDRGDYGERLKGLVAGHLATAAGAADLAALMAAVVELAEAELALHRVGAEHIACKTGCGTCCALNVAVLFPEVVAIVEYLRNSWEPPRQRAFESRLTELSRRVQGLDDVERICLRLSCAFLDGSGACSIYPVRPLICRSITSLDPSDCEAALNAPLSGEEHPVFMNLFQKFLLEQTFTVLGESQKQHGLEARSGQLTVGVWKLLAAPHLARAFLEGQPVWPPRSA